LIRQGFVAFGANLGQPREQFERLLQQLPLQGLAVLKASPLYRTPPLGPPQPDFLNAVVAFQTDRTAEEVLLRLLSIEESLGRKRTARWGPRSIDLDLLLLGDEVQDSPTLTLPHPELHRRAFVLVPLVAIAPDALHPLLRKTARALLDALPAEEVGRVLRLDNPSGPD
jgi:2-amino-4-hydroxy-6-hydroxymethyldihydropteridine diphosphokinase